MDEGDKADEKDCPQDLSATDDHMEEGDKADGDGIECAQAVATGPQLSDSSTPDESANVAIQPQAPSTS
jgi:hypothetical protein